MTAIKFPIFALAPSRQHFEALYLIPQDYCHPLAPYQDDLLLYHPPGSQQHSPSRPLLFDASDPFVTPATKLTLESFVVPNTIAALPNLFFNRSNVSRNVLTSAPSILCASTLIPSISTALFSISALACVASLAFSCSSSFSNFSNSDLLHYLPSLALRLCEHSVTLLFD